MIFRIQHQVVCAYFQAVYNYLVSVLIDKKKCKYSLQIHPIGSSLNVSWNKFL